MAMFFCTTPTTSDPPLGAASHVPVSGGHPGAIQVGLRNAVLDCGGDNDIAVTPYFPSTAKNLALQDIISGPHHVNQNLSKLYTINLEVVLLLRQFLID